MKFIKPFFFVLIILMVTTVLAQPPVTTVQEFPEGYTLGEIDFQYLKVGEDLVYSFYLYNHSTGVLVDNSTTNCTFHLVDSHGNFLITEQVDYNEEFSYWTEDISGTNISEIGYYYYGVDCQDGYGGALSGIWEVTYTGFGFSEPEAIMYVGILALLIFILVATLYGMNYLPMSNQRDEEGRILSITYLKYLRLPLWLFAYFVTVTIMFFASNISYGYLKFEMFGDMFFALFSIMMALSPVIIIVTMISFFVRFFHDKQFQKMINRGMMPGGGV